MELIPAIDLLDGRVVRLARGDFDAVTAYGDDPVAVARRWRDEGATRLHLVDLDAARHGRPQQRAVIERIVAEVGVPCQVAGGIRTEADAASALEAGADRVVLGSALLGDPEMARRLAAAHGPAHVVAALDIRGDTAVGDGWITGARTADARGHAAALSAAGIAWFAVTAIARDGGMAGPDLALLATIRATVPTASIIASGGVGSLADVRTLAGEGYAAVILGRALYEGALTLPDALAASDG